MQCWYRLCPSWSCPSCRSQDFSTRGGPKRGSLSDRARGCGRGVSAPPTVGRFLLLKFRVSIFFFFFCTSNAIIIMGGGGIGYVKWHFIFIYQSPTSPFYYYFNPMRGRGPHLPLYPLAMPVTGVLVGGGGGLGGACPPNKIKPWHIFNSIQVIYKYSSKFSSYWGMPQIAHFQVEKWKSSLPWEGGTPPSPPPPPRSVATLPRAWSLCSLAKIAPPKCFGSLRHWCQYQYSAARICQARVKAREQSEGAKRPSGGRVWEGGFLPCHGREIFFLNSCMKTEVLAHFMPPKNLWKRNIRAKAVGNSEKK